jgi:tyrosine-protein kinase Etk/Wzc
VKIDGVLFNGMDFRRRYNGNQGYRHGGYKYSEYEYAAKAA